MSEFTAMIKQSTIVHLCFAISYFTSGLIINVLQFTTFVLIKPFNKKLYRSIMYYLCYSFYCQLVFLADWWSNSKLYLYVSKEDLALCGSEHGLLVMNHSYEVDWLIGWMLCEKINVLGNCKAYAKKAIQYIPTVGWSWKFAEFVFLERSYDKDKEIIHKQLKEIFDYPDPVWLLLNAEGTRFTPTKHAASVKFAEERGMTVLKHHLIPRTKGFTASLPRLQESCPGLYDIQIVFKKDDKVPPTIKSLLNGKPVTGYMHVRRIDMKSIPSDEEGASEWLHNLFREKDRLQDSFFTHGDFFTSSGFEKKEAILQKPRISSLINTVCWAIVTLTPMLYYLATLLLSGKLVYFSIAAGILFAFYLLMVKTIGMSKISKGSSYGSSDKNNKDK